MSERVKILVIDDEQSITDALDIILSAKGYEVVTSNNGYEALNLLALQEPHLILLDIMMVPLDGLEFIKRLAALGLEGKYPIIVMTAMLGVSEDLAQLKRDGSISSWLFKPLDDNKLGKIYMLLDDIEKLTTARKETSWQP